MDPPVAIPHLPAQFEIDAAGTKVVEQGSPEDIAANVYRIAVCPIGYREDLPEFGVPFLAFKTIPLPLEQLKDAIARWEPDAPLTAHEEQEALGDAYRRVTLELEAP